MKYQRCRCKHTTFDHGSYGLGECLLNRCTCKKMDAIGELKATRESEHRASGADALFEKAQRELTPGSFAAEAAITPSESPTSPPD